MEEHGIYNHNFPVGKLGLNNPGAVYYNLMPAELCEQSLKRGEAVLTADGALRALTGQHTGRSAKDKFIVCDDNTRDVIWWDNNKAMSPAHFALLKEDMLAHAEGKELFVEDLIGGADAANRLPTRVITEYAWHAMFIRNLLIRPGTDEVEAFVPQLTIVNLPSFAADPKRYGCRTETVIACDLEAGLVLIAGTSYAGEMKKSVFTALNYALPGRGVMPMHCSANVGADGDAAVFFGLSGTGKTTLSAGPDTHAGRR